MPRRRSCSDLELVSFLRRDLFRSGAAGFEVTTTAREMGLTSAAIHARLGTRLEIIARLWLEPRTRYVNQLVGALELRDFEDSIVRAVAVPFERWRDDPHGTRFALSMSLKLLVGEDAWKTKGKRLQARLTEAVDAWRARWARRRTQARDVWYALVNGPAADVLTRGDTETEGFTPLEPLAQHAELARSLRR